METIEVWKTGTKVRFKKEFFSGQGIIISIMVKSPTVILYEVIWINAGAYTQALLPPEMIEVDSDQTKIKIGFK